MSEHPIEGLMRTAMNSIQDMVDVNTIIGEPIETSNGMVIIPISKVCFGFAAGGSEFSGETIDEYRRKDKEEEVQYRLPFGGGSGAGISINPMAFVIVLKDSIKVLPIEHASAIDKLMDYVPDLMQRVNNIVNRTLEVRQEENNKNDYNNTNINNKNNEEGSMEKQSSKENKEKTKKNHPKEEKESYRKNNLKTKSPKKSQKIEEIEIVYDEEVDNEDMEDDYDIDEYLEDE